MKKKFCLLSILTLLLFLLCVPVSADTGPKPSFEIHVKHLAKSDYIVGLLGSECGGPHYEYTPDLENTSYGSLEDLAILYSKITIPEGKHLFDISKRFMDVDRFIFYSGYYYPRTFQMIIYNERTDQVYISEEIQCEAFNAHLEVGSLYDNFKIEEVRYAEDENIFTEAFPYVLRFIFTLVIELILALLFHFTKKSLGIIAITNTITQLGLILYIQKFTYLNGTVFSLYLGYIGIEIGITVVESIVYWRFTKRGREQTNKYTILYAILANLSSFIIGWIFFSIMFEL